MEAPNLKYLPKNEYIFINIGLSIRYPKMISLAIKRTYKAPKKALTNQLTKSIKRLPEISLKIFPTN